MFVEAETKKSLELSQFKMTREELRQKLRARRAELRTGVKTPRPTLETLINAMDDAQTLNVVMQISKDTPQQLRERLRGAVPDDDEEEAPPDFGHCPSSAPTSSAAK